MTPEIILGSPGTGKTESLLGIVEQAIDSGMAPEEIGYVSFTKRAATEAIVRASEKFNLPRDRFPFFRTLHSICFRQLGLTRQDVLQGRMLKDFADWVGIDITTKRTWEEGSTFGFLEGDRILHMENLARVSCKTLRQQHDEDDDDLSWDEVDRVSRSLEEYKRKKHLLDFTDFLTHYAAGSMRPRIRMLCVDEAQDLSELQWKVVARLADGCERVVIAGDDDQAVYVWAGAALQHFLGLEGNVTGLGQSYRVPRVIQDLALDTISRVTNRRPKEWRARDEEGELHWLGSMSEADLSGPDVLVLARNNFVLVEQVVPVLRSEGILYSIHGEPSLDPKILSAIMSWEQLRKKQPIPVEDARNMIQWSGNFDLRARINMTKDGDVVVYGHDMPIWHDGLDHLPMDEVSYLLAARRSGESTQRAPRVRLSTIHGSKGAQADHVVLLLDQALRTAEEAEKKPDDETRTWYVGCTRARQQLSVVQQQGMYGWIF